MYDLCIIHHTLHTNVPHKRKTDISQEVQDFLVDKLVLQAKEHLCLWSTVPKWVPMLAIATRYRVWLHAILSQSVWHPCLWSPLCPDFVKKGPYFIEVEIEVLGTRQYVTYMRQWFGWLQGCKEQTRSRQGEGSRQQALSTEKSSGSAPSTSTPHLDDTV